MNAHHLEGSSRFMLLGMLAELNGVTRAPNADPTTDERERLLQEFRDKHAPPGLYPPGVLEEQDLLPAQFEAVRKEQYSNEPFAVTEIRAAMSLMESAKQRADDRELANAMLGERVVDAMFGDGPVRIKMSGKPTSAATKDEV